MFTPRVYASEFRTVRAPTAVARPEAATPTLSAPNPTVPVRTRRPSVPGRTGAVTSFRSSPRAAQPRRQATPPASAGAEQHRPGPTDACQRPTKLTRRVQANTPARLLLGTIPGLDGHTVRAAREPIPTAAEHETSVCCDVAGPPVGPAPRARWPQCGCASRSVAHQPAPWRRASAIPPRLTRAKPRSRPTPDRPARSAGGLDHSSHQRG